MGRRQRSEKTNVLHDLIEAASADVLRQMVEQLICSEPGLQLRCIDFLLPRVTVTQALRSNAKAQAVLSLWREIEPNIEELETYGGGDNDELDYVAASLDELSQRLTQPGVPRKDRRELLDIIWPYIESDNSGIEDQLYDVAYSACHDEQDLRELAARFEGLERDWPLEHARRIYRGLGDREKYLSLRARNMVLGGDYYDLVTFYWEAGEHQKALEVAREGMEKATGRMDELRAFLAERALESGNRQEYLDIHLAQALDRMTVESYTRFASLCSPDEWTLYEPRVLSALKQKDKVLQLQIHVLRKEFDVAVQLISGMRYASWDIHVLDPLETVNHFACFDYMLTHADEELTEVYRV